MPLIEILALPQAGPVDERRVLAAVNRAVGAALNTSPEAVWSTWQTLPAGGYAVGEEGPDAQPRGSHPPIVHVYARRSPEELVRVVDAVASTLAAELGLDDDDVFVTTAPVRS
jgi:phenylpyruvate tautomerase PptA (4-oxalocrotonate tautomerase family)